MRMLCMICGKTLYDGINNETTGTGVKKIRVLSSYRAKVGTVWAPKKNSLEDKRAPMKAKNNVAAGLKRC